MFFNKIFAFHYLRCKVYLVTEGHCNNSCLGWQKNRFIEDLEYVTYVVICVMIYVTIGHVCVIYHV